MDVIGSFLAGFEKVAMAPSTGKPTRGTERSFTPSGWGTPAVYSAKPGEGLTTVRTRKGGLFTRLKEGRE
jgi:hypothetical protein